MSDSTAGARANPAPRYVMVTVVLAAAALLAVACSSGDDDDAGTGEPAPATGSGGSTPVAGSGGAGGQGSPGSGGGSASNTSGAGSGGSGGAGGATSPPDEDGGAPSGDAGSDAPAEPCPDLPPSSTDCSAPLAPGDDRVCMIGSRKYLLYAPPNYRPCEPAALVVDAHGALETAEEQAAIDPDGEFCAVGICWAGPGSGWRIEADQPGGGFIVATPQGVNNMWGMGDVAFIMDLVDEVKQIADIDPAKVYMSGISNGAALTYWAGCSNANVFSGLSPNSGGSNCASIPKPLPVITFDAMPDFAYASAVAANDTMVMRNNCKNGPKEWLTIDASSDEPLCRSSAQDNTATIVPCSTVTPAIMPAVCQMWDGCDGGVEVVFCEVSPANSHGAGNEAGDAHIIYANASSLNTPSLAWRFFQRFW